MCTMVCLSARDNILKSSIIFLFKVLNNMVVYNDVSDLFKFKIKLYDTRRFSELIEYIRVNWLLPDFSPSHRLRRKWNGLNIDLDDFTSFFMFKKQMKIGLLQYY